MRDCTVREEADRRCLPLHHPPIFEEEIHKFSDIDYNNHSIGMIEIIQKLHFYHRGVDKYLLTLIIHLFFTCHDDSASPDHAADTSMHKPPAAQMNENNTSLYNNYIHVWFSVRSRLLVVNLSHRRETSPPTEMLATMLATMLVTMFCGLGKFLDMFLVNCSFKK